MIEHDINIHNFKYCIHSLIYSEIQMKLSSVPGTVCYSQENSLLLFSLSLVFKEYDRLTPGEGDGTPLQYSCLENPMDGGAW